MTTVFKVACSLQGLGVQMCGHPIFGCLSTTMHTMLNFGQVGLVSTSEDSDVIVCHLKFKTNVLICGH